MFVQWTRSGSSVSGSLQQAILADPAGSGVNRGSVSFTGTIAGDGLTLQLTNGEELDHATALTGQISDPGFSLTYPGAAAGSLITIDFAPGQLSDYNQAVSDLRGSQYSNPCSLYLAGHDAEIMFTGSTAATDCESFVQTQAGQQNTWTTTEQQSYYPVSPVCDLSNGTDEAVVDDDGGQAYGKAACSQLLSEGWTQLPDSPSGNSSG